MRTRPFRAKALSLLMGATLIIAACGDDDDGGAADDPTATEASTAAGDTEAPTATTAAEAGTATTMTEGSTATEATEGSTASDDTAAATTAAGATEETSAPTAPPRGDADLVIWADDTRTPVVEEIATTFAEENGITVDVQELEFGQIREQLSIAGPAGNGPDIVIGANDWLGEFVANGVVAPLDVSGVADQFQQVAIDAFTYDGQTYGLPYAIENIALVRNTELAPEAPATFEEMIQVANEFKAQHANDPTYQGLALQVGNEGDGYHLQPILSAFGGYVFAQNEDGSYNTDDVGLDSEGGLAAAQFLAEQAAGGLLSADTTYDVMIQSFGEGKAPFAITGPWAISQEDSGFAAMGVPYEVTPIPAREGGEPPSVFVGVQGFMVSAFSQQADLATSFVLDFMSQETSQTALYEAGGRPPAHTAAFEAASADPDIKGFGDSGANGIPQPAVPQMSVAYEAIGLAEINVLQGGDPVEEFTAAAETVRAAAGG